MQAPESSAVTLADLNFVPDEETIRDLFRAAQGTTKERRDHGREPFFQPGLVIDAKGREFTVFTRDISFSGIGLIHGMPLTEGPATLHLQLADRPRTRLPLIVEWCLPCGEGFFISGATFTVKRKSTESGEATIAG